jgi:hypothetical protein
LNDKELADLMADPELEDASDGLSDEDAGVVEGGIPPEISNDQSVDSSEQSFSVDDFGDSGEDGSVSAPPSTDSEASATDETSAPAQESPVVSSSPPANGSSAYGESDDGEVAQFRRTLAGLSRQLELDRLALLHKTLSGNGEKLPTLDQIADDISGANPLTPDGDCDEYGSRSTARLEGWVSGLVQPPAFLGFCS